ncbi:MAG: glycosyltransferase [Weeksellaceae bacterium]|nr:glycosyltransferase [Weeksellaceae bacterium]
MRNNLKKRILKKQFNHFENNQFSEFFSKSTFKDAFLFEKDQSLPKISIIMPSFNQVEFIERSILSVLNQNYRNFELIIIDGGSTDGTVDLIRKYEKYIFHWVSEKDKGQSDALNKGIRKASGDLVGWMNSDDVYLENAFQEVANEYLKNTTCKVFFGNTISIDENDKLIDLNLSFPFSSNHLKHEGFVAVTQSLFWSSKLNNAIHFDISLFTNMDLDIYFQINEAYSIRDWKYVNCFFGGFRKQMNQKTSEKYSAVIMQDLLYIENKHDIKIRRSLIKKIIYKSKRFWYNLYLSR